MPSDGQGFRSRHGDCEADIHGYSPQLPEPREQAEEVERRVALLDGEDGGEVPIHLVRELLLPIGIDVRKQLLQ
jgi:hypothetical protein